MVRVNVVTFYLGSEIECCSLPVAEGDIERAARLVSAAERSGGEALGFVFYFLRGCPCHAAGHFLHPALPSRFFDPFAIGTHRR